MNSVQNKTFTSSGITFQYPGNWSDNITITWNSGDQSLNQSIGSLGNGNITLGVLFINQSKYTVLKSFNITTLGDLAVQTWKQTNNNTNIISQTSKQMNNLTINEIIYTAPDPGSNVLYKYYYVMTGEKGKTVYILRFGAPDADFAKYYPQFQSIANSIKLQ